MPLFVCDPQKEVLECGLRKDSIFYTLGENGLIAFTDYMFLLVVLSSKSPTACFW